MRTSDHFELRDAFSRQMARMATDGIVSSFVRFIGKVPTTSELFGNEPRSVLFVRSSKRVGSERGGGGGGGGGGGEGDTVWRHVRRIFG